MSTREALIQDLMKQPEGVVRKLRRYLDHLVGKNSHLSDMPDDRKATWPPNYFDQTAGAFSGEPFERPPQLPFDERGQW